MMNALFATFVVVSQILLCLLAADFLGGFLHWFEDTWLVPGRSAILDRWIVAPNIEHHERPGGIRECSYWTLNCVCIALAVAVSLLLAACGIHAWQAYLVLAFASQSNQFHAWAHTSNPPWLVGFLQRYGVLQSAKMHAIHHRRPYGVRYCTTTNMLNAVLDRSNFWNALEFAGERLGAHVVRATDARRGY